MTAAPSAATISNPPAPILLVDSLERLPIHLNTVLIQIGKLFRHQSHPELKFVSRQKVQAHEILSKATRHFHDALDEVEIEILNARAVLERDLNKIKVRKAERENAQRTLNGNLEADIHDQPEDVTMQDVPVDPGIKVQTPEEEQVSKDVMKEMSETVMTNADQEAQSKVHTPQELKGLGLDNALFDQEIAQDFGAADGEPSFDLFNSIQGEDLSGEFTAGDQPSAATPIISTTSSQPAGTTNNAYNNVDNSLLIEALEDITAPIDSEAVKDFGDIDFGTIDQDQGHIDGNGDPFGDHNNSGFDDFFNS